MYLPKEIAKRCEQAETGKTTLPVPRMFALSIFAGVFIALGAFGSQVASTGVPVAAVGRFLSALIFPVGLLMVIAAGAELFTGNSLIIISVLRGDATIKGLLTNWTVVFLGNFAGSILVAAILTYGHSYSLYDGALAQAVVSTAVSKVSLSWQDAVLRGILCNILVCIAVWISFSAEDAAGKIMGLYLPIVLFVISGYEHCVANMYFVPAGLMVSSEYGIAAEGLNVGAFLLRNLLPVTIGNLIGGAGFVGGGYYYIYLRKSGK